MWQSSHRESGGCFFFAWTGMDKNGLTGRTGHYFVHFVQYVHFCPFIFLQGIVVQNRIVILLIFNRKHMILSLSLYNCCDGYSMRPIHAVIHPLINVYACKHLYLARGADTSFQRWGHYTIAVIQFIPGVGLLASLLERVIAAALKLFFKESFNHWYAANNLVHFCKKIPGGEVKAKQFACLGLIKQADELRKWLTQDLTIASMPHLNLDNMNLRCIPPEIKYFKQLAKLSLKGNKLFSLPKEIGSLSNLRELSLENNMLYSLPKEMGKLTLTDLNVGSNSIRDSLEIIFKIKSLKKLNLHSNGIKVLPKTIGNLTLLEYLNISGNFISPPPEIGRLVNLRYLDASSNDPSICCCRANMTLPPEIDKLVRLEELVLADSNLKDLPIIRNLIALEKLDLSGNKFSRIPFSVFSLQNLRSLNISRNGLSFIDPQICHLQNLMNLELDHNPLSTLPPHIGHLSTNCQISLDSKVTLPSTLFNHLRVELV